MVPNLATLIGLFLKTKKWLDMIIGTTRVQGMMDGQYATRYTLNSCLDGIVISLPQKRSGESNGVLVDNTKGLS